MTAFFFFFFFTHFLPVYPRSLLKVSKNISSHEKNNYDVLYEKDLTDMKYQ